MSGLIGARGEPLYPPRSVADQTIALSAANARIAELEAALRLSDARLHEHGDTMRHPIRAAIANALRIYETR